MGIEKQNAYHVKLKLTPKQKVYKSMFVQGIVLERTPVLAEKLAIKELTQAVKKETFEVEVKVHSIVKLRKDFMLYPEEN